MGSCIRSVGCCLKPVGWKLEAGYTVQQSLFGQNKRMEIFVVHVIEKDLLRERDKKKPEGGKSGSERPHFISC